MKKIKEGRCFGRTVLMGVPLWFSVIIYCGISFAAPADFPKKEITIVVNYGPGGGRDILARGLGSIMSKYLGVPVVITNMPGAGGARGLISLFHSAPDGYTIGVGSGSDISSQIFENRQEYDNKKFTYIGRAQSSPSFFFVKSDSPFHSVKDFKTFGKPVRHSAFSVTSNHSVVATIIANREGFPLVAIGGYKSAADTLLGVIRGEVEFCGGVPSSAAQFVRAGRIRPIMALDQKRSLDFPNTPTVGEEGHPDLGIFTTDFWFMGPPGVPRARIQILEDTLTKTLRDAEFLKWAKGAGIDIKPGSGEEISKLVFNLFAILERYKDVIEKEMK